MWNQKISECLMENCAFNQKKMCHARSITVGDSDHPRCDTFIKSGKKSGMEEIIGNVGACKVMDCSFNHSLECTSDGINVGTHRLHADCTTFKKKM